MLPASIASSHDLSLIETTPPGLTGAFPFPLAFPLSSRVPVATGPWNEEPSPTVVGDDTEEDWMILVRPLLGGGNGGGINTRSQSPMGADVAGDVGESAEEIEDIDVDVDAEVEGPELVSPSPSRE
jgi:hypothetical protein